jgi:precorrin-6A/cobalt-precorrin-6A reductase
VTASPACPRVLILGGTTEGRLLAARLMEAGVPVVSSLAGRLARPGVLVGEVRSGGFGGPAGFAAWLSDQQIAAVIDATHPFAAGIGVAATTACARVGVPLLRVERPPWQEQPGDRWHRVSGLEQAASILPELGRRALLAIGRQGVGAFATVREVWFLVRCIEAPAGPLPERCALHLARGPFTVTGELALLRRRRIAVIVTKNSGGSATEAKLAAARHLDLPVLMIERPVRPPTPHRVEDVDAAFAWTLGVVGDATVVFHDSIDASEASRSR